MLTKPGLLKIATFFVLLSGCGVAEQIPGNSGVSLSFIVSRIDAAQAQGREPSAYQIIRKYRLTGAKNSNADSEVIAEVDFVPPSEHTYTIQKSSGSGHGEQVVRRILDQELHAKDDQIHTAALTSANYDFSYLGQANVEGHSCYRLGLTPKRKANDLVRGEALVDQRTFQVRQVEGDLAKTPSWWLRKVHVTMGFGDVQGTWLQTQVEAVADVRIFGQHTLTSQLVDYRSVDVLAMKTAPVNPRGTTARSHRRPKKADPAYSAVFTR